MKLRDCALLTDENIDPAVVAYLRLQGFQVLDVCEEGWQGTTDTILLQRSLADKRVIVTHDSDFGTLAHTQGQSVFAILYLRPGHIEAEFTIGTLNSVLQLDPEFAPPVVLVAKRLGRNVTLRIRSLVH
jgi:predicted nuclease of predicted toxin-antitoxin system